MSDSKQRDLWSRGRRWLVYLPGVILAAAGALFTSLAPTSVSAKPAASDSDTLERRILAVREAADAADVKPGAADSSQIAQWRNWPNWPNWGNYWNNWPNW